MLVYLLIAALTTGTVESPTWFKDSYINDQELGFYCQGTASNEEDALKTARASCAKNFCQLFGVEVKSSLVVEETLTTTSYIQTVIEQCPDVRLIGKKEQRKSVECYQNSCSAFIHQIYPQEEFQKEQKRLNSPGIHPDLLLLLKRAEEIPLTEFPTGMIDVSHAWINYQGNDITRQYIYIDGVEVIKCDRMNISSSALCLENHQLSTGSHLLTMIYKTNDYQVSFRTDNPIHIKQDVVTHVDAEWLLTQAKQNITLSADALSKPEGCVELIKATVTAPACYTEELIEIQTSLQKAIKSCTDNPMTQQPSKQWLMEALNLTERNIFHMPPERCLDPHTVNKTLGYFLGKEPDSDHFWEGLFKKHFSTWQWAQDIGYRMNKDHSFIELLDHLNSALQSRIERAQVAESIIAMIFEQYQLGGYGKKDNLIAGKHISHMYDKSNEQPFTLDVTTLQGHVNYYLTHDFFKYYFPADKEISIKLANYVQTHRELNCGNYVYAKNIVSYFLRDNYLSDLEWQALQNMINQTENDRGLRPCTEALSGDIQSDIPRADRLAWFVQVDCAREPVNKSYSVQLYMNIKTEPHRIKTETKELLNRLVPNCEI